MLRPALFAFAVIGVTLGCSPSGDPKTAATPATPVAGSATVAYADVQAIFDKSCVSCHGAMNPKDGVSLINHEALMKGGEAGPTVVSGDSAGSLLIQVMRGLNGKKQMPFGTTPLPEDEIKKVEAWITGGAKA
jgi:mono/diheme cytochrome c family protein